jgi:glycosyltransferase involved in cell wall biosynthesis
MKPSYGIITISFRRAKVLELWCASIKRLRLETEQFIPAVVVGDAEHYEICSKYHIHHIAMQNHPATRKWNKGIEYLMGLGVDYVMILGSDDIVSTDLLKTLMTTMESNVDLIGIKTIYFYCAEGKQKGQIRKLVSTNTLGVCRTIHRRVIEQTGVLWKKDSSWGMDSECARNIAPFVRSMKVVDGIVVDVKNSESLNKWTMWSGRLPESACAPKELFLGILSEEEKEILESI